MTEDATDRTLGGVSHVHPVTEEAFGRTQAYSRGTYVAADGGRDSERSAGATLADIDHQPPGETDGAHRAYERGHEGRERHA